MPTVITEVFDSDVRVAGDGPSIERRYYVTGAADSATAQTDVLAAVPTSYGGYPRRRVKIDVSGESSWWATVTYEPYNSSPPPAATGESLYEFDTGGGQVHVTNSLATVNSYAPAGSTVPDYDGAMGVTENSIEGADIAARSFVFSETHYVADASITTAYKSILFYLTGRVNNANFKGLNAGECLFLGARGSKRGQGDWEITYSFACSPNVAGLTIGNITGIAKSGWEYLWVSYEDVEDAAAKMLVRRPRAVYIERVYESGDFSTLNIGV